MRGHIRRPASQRGFRQFGNNSARERQAMDMTYYIVSQVGFNIVIAMFLYVALFHEIG